jgi:predicted amidohydrolase
MPMPRFTRHLIVAAAFVGWTLPSPAARAQTAVAMVQLQSSDAGNFAKMTVLAQQAKARGAQLVIFPEGSVFGWLNPAVFTQAEPIPGTYSDKFAAIATSVGIWVAAGLAERGPKAGPGSQPNAYQAYDSGILINPQGQMVLHHRKFNVLKNAFDPAACKTILNEDQCAYTPGPLSDVTTAQTPFGKTALLVCSDAYTYAPASALAALKALTPEFVIVPWGIAAGQQSDCGKSGFDATGYAADAATYLKSAFVVGANATGPRNYGRFLPSLYCGDSGYAAPTGQNVETSQPTEELVLLTIPKSFDANAGPIWNRGDAPGKCPATCTAYNATWNGQWTTTEPGQMSVCGCVPGH